MADEESHGGGGGFKSILTRKYSGVPVWVIAVVLIVIIGLYLRSRAASKQSVATTDGTGSLEALIRNSTFPFGQPMAYSSDIYVNTTDTVDSVDPTPAPVTTPKTVTAMQGWNLNTWILDLQKLGINTDVSKLAAANPGFINDVYTSGSQANTFKGTKTYNLG